MQYLITYYSYSGNTDKVARVLAKMLKGKGEVRLERLKVADEIKTFLAQCRAALTKKRAVLDGNATFNVSDYDFVLIGSPVWAFRPTPAINTYLDGLNGLNGKKALIFLTSGSGVGVERCFKKIKTVLRNKGASDIYELNIQDRRVDDEEYITRAAGKFI